MRGGPRIFPQGFTCPVVLWILPARLRASLTGLSPSLAGLPRAVLLRPPVPAAVLNPKAPAPWFGLLRFRSPLLPESTTPKGLFFLFLRLLRCFSSPGSPCTAMDSLYSGRVLPCRVSPFRYLRFIACLRLPAAFRSLPRLSSAPQRQGIRPVPFLA